MGSMFLIYDVHIRRYRLFLPYRYVFFGVELIKSGGEANDFSWYKAGDKSNRKAKLAYESFFSLAVRVPTSPEYNLFVAKVVERATFGNSASGEHSSETSAVINSVNVGLRPESVGRK